jgi:hypothetical protein
MSALRSFVMIFIALSPVFRTSAAPARIPQHLEERETPPLAPVVAASSCVRHETRVKYSLGYDHLVDLRNDCKKAVSCSVFTDVNPKKQTVAIQPGASATVVTYVGSPAREFKATVDCSYMS